MPEIDWRIEDKLEFDLSGTQYKLEKLIWQNKDEAGGKVHIFVDVVDKAGDRIVGEKVEVSWLTGSTTLTIEEKLGEPWAANFNMSEDSQLGNPEGSYCVECVGDSDVICGFGLGTPETPDVPIHTCFGLVFVKLDEPVEPDPPEEPEPEQPQRRYLIGYSYRQGGNTIVADMVMTMTGEGCDVIDSQQRSNIKASLAEGLSLTWDQIAIFSIESFPIMHRDK